MSAAAVDADLLVSAAAVDADLLASVADFGADAVDAAVQPDAVPPFAPVAVEAVAAVPVQRATSGFSSSQQTKRPAAFSVEPALLHRSFPPVVDAPVAAAVLDAPAGVALAADSAAVVVNLAAAADSFDSLQLNLVQAMQGVWKLAAWALLPQCLQAPQKQLPHRCLLPHHQQWCPRRAPRRFFLPQCLPAPQNKLPHRCLLPHHQPWCPRRASETSHSSCRCQACTTVSLSAGRLVRIRRCRLWYAFADRLVADPLVAATFVVYCRLFLPQCLPPAPQN